MDAAEYDQFLALAESELREKAPNLGWKKSTRSRAGSETMHEEPNSFIRQDFPSSLET